MSKGKFLLGIIIGAVAGLLSAPKSGKETRSDLKAKAEELKNTTVEKVGDAGDEVSKRAKEARAKAEDTAGVVKGKAEDVADELKTKAGELKKTADDYKVRGENAVHGAIDGAKKGFHKK